MNAYGGNGVGVITGTPGKKKAKMPPRNGVTGHKPASSVQKGGDLRSK